MKKLLFALFIISLNFPAQTHLNKNWVWFNENNSGLNSNYVAAIFEDRNGYYWISNGSSLRNYYNGEFSIFDSTNSPLNGISIHDVSETDDGKLLFGTGKNGIYILSNNSWDSLNTSNAPLPDNFIYRVTVDNQNRYWLGIPNYGIAVYDNGNWIIYDDQNSFQGIGDLNFIEVDSSNNIWVGTDFFGLYYYNGNGWIKAIGGQFSGGPNQAITALIIDPGNKKWATINMQSGESKIAESLTDTSFVYYDSTDWGFSFTLFSYDGAVIDQNNIKYFGTTNGLLIFDNGNWQFLDSSNSPVPYNWFREGLVDSRNNKVYILSSFQPHQDYGLIFFNQDSVSVTSVESHSIIINDFYLSQNYPNPFNPVTKIKFSIPPSQNPLPGGARGGLVTLKVYDILANEVAVLVNEQKEPGSYEVEFDAANLSSGIYFYRLKSGSFIETKKMILLR
jgi:hypothetical protein